MLPRRVLILTSLEVGLYSIYTHLCKKVKNRKQQEKKIRRKAVIALAWTDLRVKQRHGVRPSVCLSVPFFSNVNAIINLRCLDADTVHVVPYAGGPMQLL